MAQQEAWLDCTVNPGMFSEEYAVRAELFDGNACSLFVPHEVVALSKELDEQDGAAGRLSVQVIEQKDDLVLVRLPREALEIGYFVTVQAGQVHDRHNGVVNRS